MRLMDRRAEISFSIEPFEAVLAIVPKVNGIPLTELVMAFEREKGYEPVGGYGGIIPQYFKYGPLDRYYLGLFEQDSYFSRLGRVYLLGCGDCGEVGCWPLMARVTESSESVVWDCFEQPHRRERDYSSFGPFTFGVESTEKPSQYSAPSFLPRFQAAKN